MNKEELKNYEEFMYNKNNFMKCDKCPENNGYKGFHKCGQQKCWVSVHYTKLQEVKLY